MVVFVLNAVWIALSGAYSMAFDESTHLGIIRLYAHRWLPFWSQQPAVSDSFGAINRDPSYLYHYLISFPYRLFAHFISSQTAQVIFLRSISIMLMFCAIIIFRKVLVRSGASDALVNLTIALFVLTPVVPFLAAQINYDNLLILFVAATLLQTQRFINDLQTKKRISLWHISVLAVLCALGSLVKYAFLPVFLGVGIYIFVVIFKLIKRSSWSEIYKNIRQQLKIFSKFRVLAMALLMILSIGLFMERYAVNTVKYGTPTPECDQVLSVDRCLSYSPWRRNYLTYQDKKSGALAVKDTDPINYTIITWGGGVTNQLFFAIDGTSSNFVTRNPLAITRIVSLAVIILGLVLCIRWYRELRRRFRLSLFLTVIAVYLGTLWAQNYSDFVHIGYPFAIQGRYLVPVLPLIYLGLALGFARLLRGHRHLKPALAWVAIAFLCTQGGGAAIYILKSQPSWDWPNHLVVTANNSMRRFLEILSISR